MHVMACFPVWRQNTSLAMVFLVHAWRRLDISPVLSDSPPREEVLRRMGVDTRCARRQPGNQATIRVPSPPWLGCRGEVDQ
ncbi:hypothetical protein E2C01_068472 [Portunus trituberculatus]|uniref:Uncharacterized protein n=1 Tax=Portunus trituberculatus TaxID=210409 RepID=A0A5B7I059_PORTR|nr:hypothetical protein [Portunus trituberculatus]